MSPSCDINRSPSAVGYGMFGSLKRNISLKSLSFEVEDDKEDGNPSPVSSGIFGSLKRTFSLRSLSVEDDPRDEKNGTKTFEVTDEEIDCIVSRLALEHPEDYLYLSTSYVKSLASKPNSKDMTERRTLEYSIEKLLDVLRWRKEFGAPTLLDFISLSNCSENSPEAITDPEKMVQATAVAAALNTNSQYFHGFTKDGKPIMWVRTKRRLWLPDVEAELRALTLLVDAAVRAMPEEITEFVVISDSTSPPPPHPRYMIGMLKCLVKGYPDRLGMLMSAPVSSNVQFVMKILLPLMPSRLSSKVLLYDMEQMVSKLEEILPNGKDDIPTFFGGTVNHDEYYPEEEFAQYQGEGPLKFDYLGMVQRLELARENWLSSRRQEEKSTQEIP